MREEMRYLLHLWNDGGQEQAWRASVTELRTREVTTFASCDALYAFLHECTLRKSQAGTKSPSKEE